MRPVRRAAVVRCFIIAAFVIGFQLTAAFAQAQQTAVVAGWNILGVEEIPAARIRNIAAVIRRIDPDLIVLTEVNPDVAAQSIAEELGDGYQDAVILPQGGEVVQNIALIFKEGVSVSNARLIDGTDLPEEPRSRKALTANVRIGAFDFILIGVHLKSSRDNPSRQKRTRQARAIARFISRETQGNEKDVLVIGDYNMIPPTADKVNDQVNFIAMSPTNFLRFVSTDFLNGSASHIDTCTPSLKGNLLDGYAISRTFTREYIPGTRLLSPATFGRTCSSYLRNVSDHLPVVSRFRVTTDDD